MAHEHRKHVRFAVEFPAWLYADPASGGVLATALNLSLGGMKLRLPAPLAEGREVQLEFRPATAASSIAGTGLVRWCEASQGSFLAGVEFIGMDAASRAAIETLAAQHEERRRHPRKPLGFRVSVRAGSMDDLVAADGIDISLGGMQVTVRQPRAIGNRVAVEVVLRGGQVVFKADSVVRWCRVRGADRYSLGLEFRGLDEEAIRFIERLRHHRERAPLRAMPALPAEAFDDEDQDAGGQGLCPPIPRPSPGFDVAVAPAATGPAVGDDDLTSPAAVSAAPSPVTSAPPTRRRLLAAVLAVFRGRPGRHAGDS